MKHALLFICAVICTMLINGCETAPQIPVNNKVTFSGEYIPGEQADVQARSQFQKVPRYPWYMRNAGITGIASIAFMVELNGHTSQVQVESATNREFGEAAKGAVEQWVFTPALRNGVPVRVIMKVPIAFGLAYPK